MTLCVGSYVVLAQYTAKPKPTAKSNKIASSTPKVATTVPKADTNTPSSASQNKSSNPNTTSPVVTPTTQPTPVQIPILSYSYSVGDIFSLGPFTVKVTSASFKNSSNPGCTETTTDKPFEVDFVYTTAKGTTDYLANYNRELTLVTSKGEELTRTDVCHSYQDNYGLDISSNNLSSSYLVYFIPSSTVSAVVQFNGPSSSAVVKMK